MRSLLLIGCLIVATAAFTTTARAECPKGTEEIINETGVADCITITKQQPKPPVMETCPVGSQRYADFNGQVVCRRLDTNQQLMNFTGSCPLGTGPTVDVGGNRVCNKF